MWFRVEKQCGLARLLHLLELLGFKLVVFDRAPVVCRRIHGETRGQSAIDRMMMRIVPGAAIPGSTLPRMKDLHVLKALTEFTIL